MRTDSVFCARRGQYRPGARVSETMSARICRSECWTLAAGEGRLVEWHQLSGSSWERDCA